MSFLTKQGARLEILTHRKHKEEQSKRENDKQVCGILSLLLSLYNFERLPYMARVYDWS